MKTMSMLASADVTEPMRTRDRDARIRLCCGVLGMLMMMKTGLLKWRDRVREDCDRDSAGVGCGGEDEAEMAWVVGGWWAGRESRERG